MSTSPSEHEVTQLEREAEATRDQLRGTLNELSARLSRESLECDFEHIKNQGIASTQNAARDAVATVRDKIKSKAMENPLGAVAIGAGIAWPLVRLGMKMPIPLALIGAGVALLRTQSPVGSSSSTRTTAQYSSEQLRQASARVGNVASDAMDRMKQGAADTAESATSFATQAADRASASMASVKGAVSDAAEVVSRSVTSAYQEALESAYRAGYQAAAGGRSAQRGMQSVLEENPVLIGALSATAGAALGALLPRTQVEANLFGEMSANLRQKAVHLSQEQMQSAKEKASEVIAEIKEAVQGTSSKNEGALTSSSSQQS